MIEYCDICGQQLTDASGRKRMVVQDFGIYHKPAEQALMCAYCYDGIKKLIEEYSDNRINDSRFGG